MNSENNPNANASDTTSRTAPPKPSGAQADPKKVTEADFLAREQAQARAAISGVLADMKQALAQGADLKEWTRQHPWILMGGATVAGALAGMLLTPTKEESLKEFFEKKWESLKGTASPAAEDFEQSARAAAAQPQPQEQHSSILTTIIREAMKVVGPTLGGLISGAIAGQQAGADDGAPHHGNGHGNPAPQPESVPGS
jgi:hypothetical protein